MSEVSVNGVEIHYREAGDGFPIVFVHGYTGNLRNWALTVPALTECFRTVSMDLRGHGRSSKPPRAEDYNYDAMAEDVYGLLSHLGISDCYLVGHSMGGFIAQRLILAHPELFRALVLVDTAAETTAGRSDELRRLAGFAEEHGMEAAFDETARTSSLASNLRDHPGFNVLWREQFLMTSLEAYVGCARAALSRQSSQLDLPSIGVPTLIICGENDEPFLEPSRKMHEAIKGSELAIISGAGHGPQMETPGEFNRALTEFLSKVHQTVPAGG